MKDVHILVSKAEAKIAYSDLRDLEEKARKYEELAKGIDFDIDENWNNEKVVVVHTSYNLYLKQYTIDAVIEHLIKDEEARKLLEAGDKNFFDYEDYTFSAQKYSDEPKVDILENEQLKELWDEDRAAAATQKKPETSPTTATDDDPVF